MQTFWKNIPPNRKNPSKECVRWKFKCESQQHASSLPEVKDVKAQTLQLAPPAESTSQNIKGEHNSFITLEKFGTLEYSENKTIFHLLVFVHQKMFSELFFFR